MSSSEDRPPALRERKVTNPRLPAPSKTVLISENATSHMQRVLSDPDMLSQLGDLSSLEQLAVRLSSSLSLSVDVSKDEKKIEFLLTFRRFFFFSSRILGHS
jgi:hypothetical protein